MLMAQIEDLIVKAMLSCANSIVPACQMFVPNSNNCFGKLNNMHEKLFTY